MSDSVHELNQELMRELRAQGNRHASEIKSLAAKVEENTEVVRKCMLDLVEFNAERSNLTRCLIDMREEHKALRDSTVAANLKLVELDTRWTMVKVLMGLNFSALGLGIAFIKIF